VQGYHFPVADGRFGGGNGWKKEGHVKFFIVFSFGITYNTTMKPSIVIDTSVFIAGLRSRHGASFKLLKLIGKKKFDLNISVPQILELESVAKRPGKLPGLSKGDIDDVIDYVCRVSHHRMIHFLWRPVLKDPGDDLILELAVEAECDYIVTHNVRDFDGAEEFNISIVTPRRFLGIIGVGL